MTLRHSRAARPYGVVPVIGSIIPNPGSAGPVTVNGTNFISGATVSFGGTPATSVVVVNANQITCTAPAHADGAVNVTVTTSAGTSGTYSFTYVTSTRLFTGDYSTSNFSQWPGLQCRTYNSTGSGWPATGSYQAQIVSDAVKGTAARYEVRSGDWPGFATGERSEVQGSAAATGGAEGDIRWYAFSTKFDASYPNSHGAWAITNQWHPNGPNSGPVLYWESGWTDGIWSLVVERQAAGGSGLGAFSILDIPYNRGVWHDVKMEVKWSASDTTGYVRLWLDGIARTFLTGSAGTGGGTTTYTVRTMIPGDTGVYYKEGLYRADEAHTDIVYHAGFHSATSESGL